MSKKIIAIALLGFMTLFSAYSLSLSDCAGIGNSASGYTSPPYACCMGTYFIADRSSVKATGDFWMDVITRCGKVAKTSTTCTTASPVVADYGSSLGLIKQRAPLSVAAAAMCN